MLQRIAQSCLEFGVRELFREVCIARGSIFVDISKTHAKLQDLSIKLFISRPSTVIDSANQILIPEAGITERRASMECLQAPQCTLSLPDRSRLVLLALGYTRTRLARPKPNREPVCRLVSVGAKVLVDFCQTSKLAEKQPPISN